MARSLVDESLPGVSLGEAVLQVIGLEVRPGSAILADTIGRIRWTAYLDTASLSATTDSAISFVKLLRSPVPLRINIGDGVDTTTVAQLSKSIESVTIIVGTADGQTFLWDINSDNGASATQSRDDSAMDDNDGVCLESSTFCHSTTVHRPYDATIVQAAHIISASTEKRGVGPVSAVVSRPDGNSFSLVQFVLCTIAAQYVLDSACVVDSSSSVDTHPQRGWFHHHPVRPALRPAQSSGPANSATVRALCQSLFRNTGYIQGTYYLPAAQLLLSDDIYRCTLI
jgi:hypothetical protein